MNKCIAGIQHSARNDHPSVAHHEEVASCREGLTNAGPAAGRPEIETWGLYFAHIQTLQKRKLFRCSQTRFPRLHLSRLEALIRF